MKFFAILKDSQFASRIMRFKLDQTAESLMKDILKEAVSKFEVANTEIPFSADYTPSQDELFIIDDFNSGIDLKDLLENPTKIPILQLEEKNDGLSLDDIVGIIATDIPNNRVLIQYFEKRNIIELSRSIIQRLVNNSYEFVAATSNGISIPTDILAILDSNKKLKFRSFQRLRHIFDMDFYFKEATDEQLKDFVNNCSKLEVIQGFDIQEIDDTMIRKKIAIINNAEILNKYSVDELKVAARSISYPLPLNQSGDKIQLPNNKKQFKDLLQFLSSNIYEDPISHATRITNSSRLYTN
ncbi:hypothetical protein [uncultured Haemophilus sp.]|uniref:hypothetical protein n=1 Tax=uncultured Haemophilus sp. TaxID=237779 RepID=UPI0025D6B273|nr:hypothetical protein [uncultured Haemophilus sp.]